MQRNFQIYLTLIFVSLLNIGLVSPVFAQDTESNTKVNWMTWEEAMIKSKTEKRPIFVDVYTNWCGWCKKMERSTFNDTVISSYLNKNFYPVKFNAEQKETIVFNDTEYKYVKSGKRGYHELAAWMMRGRMGYPTVVFLDENIKIIQPIPGFQPADKFEAIMTYFGGGHYTKTPWELYRKKYSGDKIKATPASGN